MLALVILTCCKYEEGTKPVPDWLRTWVQPSASAFLMITTSSPFTNEASPVAAASYAYNAIASASWVDKKIAWYKNNGLCCPPGQGTNDGAICTSCTPGYYGKSIGRSCLRCKTGYKASNV